MHVFNTLGAAAMLAAALTSSHAFAGNQPQRFGATAPGLVQVGPATPGVLVQQVACLMGSGDVLADVLIRNNSSATIAPGTQIAWQTSNGQGGVTNTGLPGLAPGAVIHAGAAHYPFSCSAQVQ